jgi:hypothetical protein
MTSSPLPDSSYFVGIDIAKATLDLARSDTGEILTFNNDPDGSSIRCVRRLRA